jgi:hypothetical protein
MVEAAPGRRELHLDFNASPEPLESQRYEVIYGPEIEPGPEPRTDLKVTERDGQLTVDQNRSLAFEFAKHPSGFLDKVGGPRLEYLRDGSKGLSIVEKAGTPARSTSDVRTRVTREGPIAIGIRSEWSGPSGQATTLDLTIPASKSWVQAVWTVEDPARKVSSLTLDLNLQVEGSPTLVDFGAGSSVYGQIQGRQRMDLEAKSGPPSWVVRQGEGDQPAVFARSTTDSPRPVEGWAHVMDRRRCTALAVADFGKLPGRDNIRVEADGRLGLIREFAGPSAEIPPGPKILGFWLHFVPMPVQVGAATSPQSILTPLQVDWDR